MLPQPTMLQAVPDQTPYDRFPGQHREGLRHFAPSVEYGSEPFTRGSMQIEDLDFAQTVRYI